MSDKYAAIASERHRFPVTLMCEAFGVSPSGFYAAQQRPARARTCRVERLRLVPRAAFAETKGRYGSPRIFGDLTDAGEQTSETLIARLMQEEGLVARAARRSVVTTDSDHREPIAPNLLARDFAVQYLDQFYRLAFHFNDQRIDPAAEEAVKNHARDRYDQAHRRVVEGD